MPFLGLWAYLDHLHMSKIRNSQNHCIHLVINFFVSLSIVKVYNIIEENHKCIYTVKYATLVVVLHTS
jgi:hypothetical protein